MECVSSEAYGVIVIMFRVTSASSLTWNESLATVGVILLRDTNIESEVTPFYDLHVASVADGTTTVDDQLECC